jgi:drug/metabolite transporter (DMT)-like permease
MKILHLPFKKIHFSRGQKHMLLASFLFSVMGVLIKKLDHIPAHELVFFRALVTFVICFALIRKARLSPWGVNRPILILRGLAGTGSLFLFFYTLQILPLASAVSLQFLSPIFTILIAGFFLKEPANIKQWVFFTLAFSGVFLIKGFDLQVSNFGMILAVLGAVGSAIAYTFVRVLKSTDDPVVIIFYFSMVTIPIMGPLTFFDWVTPQGWDWGLILLVGLATQFAQMNLTKALHLERAANVTHLKYLSLVYALGFGYFFFGEVIPWLALLGMLLISFSAIAANRVRSL